MGVLGEGKWDEHDRHRATFGANERRIEVDVFALSGNNTTTPIAQSQTNTGNSTAPMAFLPAAPAAGDLEIGLLGAGGNDGGVGATPGGWTNLENLNGFSSGGYGVASYYTNTNASASQTFSINTGVHWATIALDLQ